MITRFPTLRLEGGLISSDQIDRIADQKVKEFTIDDIAAAWSDIRSYWTIFQNNLAKLPEDDLATSITRNRWMMPFFSTLGYDLSSPRTAAEVDARLMQSRTVPGKMRIPRRSILSASGSRSTVARSPGGPGSPRIRSYRNTSTVPSTSGAS